MYGKTLSTFSTLALMRLSGASIVPFQFTRLANTLVQYADEIEKLGRGEKKVNLGELRSELRVIRKSAAEFEAAYSYAVPKLDAAPKDVLASINQKIFTCERRMLLEGGLPRREWYRNAIYAPGSLTGYGVKTLPGIREAAEAGQMKEAQIQLTRVVEALKQIDRQIADAAAMLSGL